MSESVSCEASGGGALRCSGSGTGGGGEDDASDSAFETDAVDAASGIDAFDAAASGTSAGSEPHVEHNV